MGPLDGVIKQIREMFSTMTPTARIMAGLMAGVIVVSLGWIVTSQQTVGTEYLLGGQNFSDEQLNKMERALGQAALRDYERHGSRLKIPTRERDLYLKALADGKAIPDEWSSAISEALLSGNNPLIAPSVTAERLKHARQQDLGKILSAMPGIKRAGVFYDSKEPRFGREAQQSASIYLEGVGGEPVSMDLMRQICEVATTHFPGLKQENVTVMDLNGNSYRGSNDPMALDQQLFLRAQREWERYYEQKVREELNVYGDVKIGVIVELDPTLKRETEQMKFDPVGTAAVATNSRKDTKSAKAAPGGRPGTEPNAIGNKSASVSAAPDQTAETKESLENLQSVIGHQATVTKEAPLTPKRVAITVGVPESYYRKVALQRFVVDPNNKDKEPPSLTEADLAKLQKEAEDNIRAALEGQLPQVRQGDDRFQLVKVYSFTDLPLPELPEPTLAETSLAWLSQSWSTVGLFALVGISLLMMFSWVRSQNPAPRDREFAQGFGLEVPEELVDSLDLGEAEAAEEKEAEPAAARFHATGGEIKEELSSLIKQNPDAAANLLRAWIGEAA